MTAPDPSTVLRLDDISVADAAALLARYDLVLEQVPAGAPIPGSYWGEPEAGIIGSTVYVRGDTPVHSMLHEACHLIVLPPPTRCPRRTPPATCRSSSPASCPASAANG